MRATWIQYDAVPETQPGVLAELIYAPRSRYQPLLFVPGLLLAGVSWIAGGVPLLTDASFVSMAVACAVILTGEFFNFGRRFGLGALVLFGGVLLWFCYDYFVSWFRFDFVTGVTPFGPEVIAKSAYLHQLFVLCAAIGIQLPMWGWLERMFAAIREPPTKNLYLLMIVAAFVVGLLPYIFFVQDSLPVAIWKEIVGGRGGGVQFSVGRTGNVNTSYGAYLAQLEQIGQVGALLAIVYVVLMRPGAIATIICLLIWLEQAAFAFGGGTRGETAYMIMPALFLVFLKYQSQAAEMFRRVSVKAYVISAVIGLIILIILQIQITYRNTGYSNMELSDVTPGLQGNSMFTEGLAGMAKVPDERNFFYGTIPGEGFVLTIPEFLWRFAYGPIPRALWPGKPIDPVWAWYNSVVTNRPEEELEGTTISTGLVGDFYFRFGIPGVIEGGMLFGWLCLLGERMLLNSQGRLIQLLSALGLLVFLFRSYRGVTFINLYPLMIGIGFLILFNRIVSPPAAPPQESSY